MHNGEKMPSKKWFLGKLATEKEPKGWILRLSIEKAELDQLLEETSLEFEGPVPDENKDYAFTLYIHDVEAANIQELEMLLKGKFGEGELDLGETAAEKKLGEPAGKAQYSDKVGTAESERKNFVEGSLTFNPLYNFDEFVIGPNSRFTVAAARAVAENPGKVYNPFFVYGKVGLGKTHIMQAVGHFAIENNKNIRIMYVTTEKFMSEVIDRIRSGTQQKMRDYYKDVDMLLVDDVQFLSESESTQEEFFHIFNYLHQQGKQIILTSDRHPNKLTTLEDRLRSRLEWGLISDIKAPSLETRLAILKKKMFLDNLELDSDILYFIGSSLISNVRELEGFLKRLSAYASLTHQAINMEITKSLMEDMLQPGEVIQSSETEGGGAIGAGQPAVPKAVPEQKKPAGARQVISAGQFSKVPSFKPAAGVGEDTVNAAFFYPVGKTAELQTVKDQLNDIISKHKLKLKIIAALEKSYVFDANMKYTSFAESCKEKKLEVAVVLGPPPDVPLDSSEFGDSLETLLHGEGIALEYIQWDDLSRSSHYLHLALDITLLKNKK